jgi:hypothetical protein
VANFDRTRCGCGVSTPEDFVARLFDLPPLDELRRAIPRSLGLGRVVNSLTRYTGNRRDKPAFEKVLASVRKEMRSRTKLRRLPPEQYSRVLIIRGQAAARQWLILREAGNLRRLLLRQLRHAILDPEL